MLDIIKRTGLVRERRAGPNPKPRNAPWPRLSNSNIYHSMRIVGPSTRHDAPVNVLGGYKFPNAPKIDLKTETVPGLGRPKARALIATIPADLSIPVFLRRPLARKSERAQAAE